MKVAVDRSQHTNIQDTRNKIGFLFIEARSYKNLSLDDVSDALKIRKCFLEAIENDDLDTLPGGVYTIGFIKNYAYYLGIDFDIISQQLNYLNIDHNNKDSLSKNTDIFLQVKSVSKYYVFAAILLLALISMFSYWYFSKSYEEPKIEKNLTNLEEALSSSNESKNIKQDQEL